MELVNLILFVSDILFSIFLAGISVPLLRGRVKMNDLYGFRLRKAFESEENWTAINRHGARLFIQWSAVIAVVSLAALFIPEQLDPTAFAILLLAPLLVVIPAIQTYFFARDL